MYDVFPSKILRVETILSLDSQTTFSALLNCPCVEVLFLTVVISFSDQGKMLYKGEKGSKKELRSPPRMISYSGSLALTFIRVSFMSLIWGQFLSFLELRCAQMQKQLSMTKKAERSAQFRFVLSYSSSFLVKMTSGLEGFSDLKDFFFAMMRVSLDQSWAMWYSSDFLSDSQNPSEYSWKKKMSASMRLKFFCTFSPFLFSSRKLSWKRGFSFLMQASMGTDSASLMSTTRQTYLSRVWYMAKSYLRVVSFSSSLYQTLSLGTSALNLSSHLLLKVSSEMNLLFQMPAQSSNMGEQRFLNLRSILPISHLKVALSKLGKYLGMRLMNSLLMSLSSVRQSSQQNQKGLFMIPQQLRVATVRVGLPPFCFMGAFVSFWMHPIEFNQSIKYLSLIPVISVHSRSQVTLNPAATSSTPDRGSREYIKQG